MVLDELHRFANGPVAEMGPQFVGKNGAACGNFSEAYSAGNKAGNLAGFGFQSRGPWENSSRRAGDARHRISGRGGTGHIQRKGQLGLYPFGHVVVDGRGNRQRLPASGFGRAGGATVMGNLLVQAGAAGETGSLSEMREVIRSSSSLTAYEPTDSDLWAETANRFVQLQKEPD
jgi:hypothetical protein